MTKGHIHAALMAQYAEDAAKTDKPWELWEAKLPQHGDWRPAGYNPLWHDRGEYRRKPIKPSIDWSHVAPERKWMATDEFGDTLLHTEKPYFAEDCEGGAWYGAHVGVPASAFASFKPGTCDWKDSLVERPEGV